MKIDVEMSDAAPSTAQDQVELGLASVDAPAVPDTSAMDTPKQEHIAATTATTDSANAAEPSPSPPSARDNDRASSPMDSNGEGTGYPKLRSQKPPLPASIRKHKPPPGEVVVIAFGSSGIRYGFASDSTPKCVFPAVAIRRRIKKGKPHPTSTNTTTNKNNTLTQTPPPPLRIPSMTKRSQEQLEAAKQMFDAECERVVKDLMLLERRRGGGKPVPWKSEIEPDMNDNWENESWLLRMEADAEAETEVEAEAEMEVEKASQEEDQNQGKTHKEEPKEEQEVQQKEQDDKKSNGDVPRVEHNIKQDEKIKGKHRDVIVGNDVARLLRNERLASHFDIIFPTWDGQLLLDTGVSANLVRKAVDLLLDFIISDLRKQRENQDSKLLKKGGAGGDPKVMSARQKHEDWMRLYPGHATSFVTLVVPETAQRRDVAELTAAVFRSTELRCGALFVHQSAVSCALGAGLATCAVVDIGHSATIIACVEDGIVCGESRIHLRYGFQHVRHAFDQLVNRHAPQLHAMLVDDYRYIPRPMEGDADAKKEKSDDENENNTLKSGDNERDSARRGYILEDEALLLRRICEQVACFNVDENDTLAVSQVTAVGGSERSLRVKLGIGLRAVPAYGLLYPALLHCARKLQPQRADVPLRRDVFQKNSDDDNFVSDIFNDLRRSGIATAALPIGLFANDAGQPAETMVKCDSASIVDAIVWSIAKAIEVKRPDQTARTPDHYRRYLNAIVLAGGGAKIDGIGPALEARIKKGFQDIGLNISDVTVIDGGRGKGDEELAAAAAVLKDLDDGGGGLLDDTDTATLPWKGGAVMVEADAVNDYWLFRDDWDARNVRALRERVPFYW